MTQAAHDGLQTRRNGCGHTKGKGGRPRLKNALYSIALQAAGVKARPEKAGRGQYYFRLPGPPMPVQCLGLEWAAILKAAKRCR